MNENASNKVQSAAGQCETPHSFLKATALLAFGLFLAIAPSPDATQLAELMAEFISAGWV